MKRPFQSAAILLSVALLTTCALSPAASTCGYGSVAARPLVYGMECATMRAP
ncbi:MAG: hypothetical protein SWK90_08850 [Chloroflexota bacterium]|nr:hypothetical protein [Chloroflexota bacterium]